MPDLWFLLKVSRPRFWIYIFGPYIVGLIAAVALTHELLEWRYAIFALFFTLPANLLVYGINDIFDYETDRLNPKKTQYEALVTPERRSTVLLAVMITCLPFVAGLIESPLVASNCLLAFVLLSVFYSAPPIRAKTKPFLDSAFNVLYILPGVFAFALVSGKLPPWQAIVAGGLWTAAMHAYSAIPDIASDREAGINTIATFCGPYGTLAICGILYLAAGVMAGPYLGLLSIALGAAYVVLIIFSFLAQSNGSLFRMYKIFPVINLIAGFVIFWWVAYEKLF